jgi:uncharacterized protein (TIRG00374 family)
MKKSSLAIISLFLGALLLVLVFRQVNWVEIKTALFLFPKSALILVFMINFLAIFIVGSYRWQIILKSQKCSISFWKLMRAKMAGFTMSYVTPTALIAGEPVRAYMIKASVIVDQMIYILCLLCVIIIGFVFLADRFALPKDVLIGFVGVFFLAAFTFYVFYQKTFKRSEDEPAFFTFIIHKTRLSKFGFVEKKLESIKNTEKSVEEFFKEGKKDFWLVVFFAFLEVFLDIAAVMVTCFYMGYWFGIPKSVGVFSLMALANLAPIPGSLGSSELALAFVFNLLGTGSDAGLAFSLIFRFINIISAFLGMIAFLYFMAKTASHSFSMEAPPFLIKIHKVFIKMFYR